MNQFSLQKLPFISVIREILNHHNYTNNGNDDFPVTVRIVITQQAVCGHNETYTEY